MGTATLATPGWVQSAVEKWYTVNQVMELTGFKRTYIYGQMESGSLRSVKAGGGRRIPESALAAWQSRFSGAGEVAE